MSEQQLRMRRAHRDAGERPQDAVIEDLVLGSLRFRVVYRVLSSDEGIAIHVFGPTRAGSEEEVLRFDCFANEPHYHLGWSYRDEPFIRITAPNPLTWTLHAIENRLGALLDEAGAAPMTETERAGLPEIVVQLGDRARHLVEQNPSR